MNEDRRSEISELNEPEQHSGASSMSKNNKLVGYSADERRMRNLEERNREKEYDDEEKQEQAPEYQEEQSDAPQDEEQEQVQEQPSKLDDAKAATGELLKGKAKEVAGNATKAVGQAAVSGVKALGSALVPLLTNPIFWIVIAVVLIFLLIFVVVFMGAAGSEEESTVGYYDSTCDFNNTIVSVTYCDSNTVVDMTLEEYVIGATYAYVGTNSYSDDAIEALMIVLKTNVLANGGYDSSTKAVSTSECDVGYNSHVTTDEYNNLLEIYNNISIYLFLSSNYTESVTTLGSADALDYDGDIAESILNSSLDYESILVDTYGSGYSLYEMDEYCAYYTVTENTAYWWPIGSSDETSPGIYGGTPTATTITSYFGNREIEGTSSNHQAIDIAGSCGVDVVIASNSGTVTKVNDTCANNGSYGNTCGGGLGNYVVIEHDDGTVTRYGHMYAGSITVSVGDTVSQGQMLGLLGNSGSVSGTTGCHLHFEVQVNGVKVDPLDYVSVDNPRPVSASSIALSYSSSSDNQSTICKTLLSSGFSKNAVIGMMINIQAESGYSPSNLQNSYESILGYTDTTYTNAIDNGTYSRSSFVYDSAGYGIIQWTYWSRKAQLYDNNITTYHVSIANLEYQIEFMIRELQSNTLVYSYITNTNSSATTISNAWCDYFERPSGSEECNSNGNCPSVKCSTRTESLIESITNYVNNGCS